MWYFHIGIYYTSIKFIPLFLLFLLSHSSLFHRFCGSLFSIFIYTHSIFIHIISITMSFFFHSYRSLLIFPLVSLLHSYIIIIIIITITSTFCLGSVYERNMQHLSFWAWFISFNMLLSGYIHFPVNDTISFFFMAQYYCIMLKFCSFY
jgi:hypothetical protein